MAVFKRKDKSGKVESKYYWTSFQFNGKRVQQSTKCTSINKAREFETNLRFQLNNDRIKIEDLNKRPKQTMLFTAAVDSFFDYLEDVKPSTESRYRTASRPLVEFFGKMAVDRISAEDVLKYRKHRRAQKRKAPARLLKIKPKAKTDKPILPATINRETTLLAMIYKHLRVAKGLKLAAPTEDISQLTESNISDRIVEIDELTKYLEHASQPLNDVAQLIYHTGMRPGEVLALTVKDIHFDAGVISVRNGKTLSARRRLPIKSEVVARILARRFRDSSNGLLFPGGRSGKSDVPLVKLNNAHKLALTESGVEAFRIYDLRHTWATHTHAANVDIETLRVLGGWANLAMLKRYVKPDDDMKAGEMQKLVEYRRNNVVQFPKAA
jgi:Site-specific recombinase XerD